MNVCIFKDSVKTYKVLQDQEIKGEQITFHGFFVEEKRELSVQIY